MMLRKFSRKSCTLLAGLCLLIAAENARAQGLAGSSSGSGSGAGISSLGSGGGGSLGGGGSGGGSNGGTSTSGLGGSSGLGSSGGIGSTSGIGSGNLSALGNGYGLSSLATGNGNNSGSNGYPTGSNQFLPFYADPYMAGVSGSNTSDVFGQPVYPITATTSTTATPQTTTNKGFTTLGVRKAPSYVTALSDDVPLIRHPAAQLEQQLRQTLERSSALKSGDRIRLNVDGAVVRLQGQVGSDRERRIAESIIRLTPGVQNVVNELAVNP